MRVTAMRVMRSAATAAAMAALVGCAAEPTPNTSRAERPLIGGDLVPENEDIGIVGLSTGGNVYCSGTLVSPTFVLTASHCITLLGGPDASAHFGSDVESGGFKIAFVADFVHPEWNNDVNRGFDVALKQLSFSQDPSWVIPMNRSPATDHIGDPYRLVGFGRSTHDTSIGPDGKKRTGYSQIHDLRGDVILTGDDDPGSIVCLGDSGGPGLIEIAGTEYVAGVHSWTSSQECYPYNGDARVDLYVESFLQPLIDEHDPTCGADGTCVRVGCSADPDCEPCGPDGTCTMPCDVPDPDCPIADIGELCQADTQCLSGGPCIWWKDDPETRFCTRSCNPGADDCPNGMSCQDRPAVGTVCYYDDDPPGVVGSECSTFTDCGSYICELGKCVTECDVSVGLTCRPGFECSTVDGANYYCHALGGGGGGGCHVAGSTRPTGPALLAMLLGLIAVRRRRKRR